MDQHTFPRTICLRYLESISSIRPNCLESIRKKIHFSNHIRGLNRPTSHSPRLSSRQHNQLLLRSTDRNGVQSHRFLSINRCCPQIYSPHRWKDKVIKSIRNNVLHKNKLPPGSEPPHHNQSHLSSTPKTTSSIPKQLDSSVASLDRMKTLTATTRPKAHSP